jgi:hypothetical protein
MPVYFCVVAASATDREEIFAVASAAAALNPFGRKVVKSGEPDFPPPPDITASVTADTGAVVLRNDRTIFDVLSVDDAKDGAIVEDDFAQAAE